MLADGGTGGFRHGRSNAARYQLPPLAPRLPAAVHIAALDYQDVPDVGTRTSLAAWRTPSGGRPGAVASSRAGEVVLT